MLLLLTTVPQDSETATTRRMAREPQTQKRCCCGLQSCEENQGPRSSHGPGVGGRDVSPEAGLEALGWEPREGKLEVGWAGW